MGDWTNVVVCVNKKHLAACLKTWAETEIGEPNLEIDKGEYVYLEWEEADPPNPSELFVAGVPFVGSHGSGDNYSEGHFFSAGADKLLCYMKVSTEGKPCVELTFSNWGDVFVSAGHTREDIDLWCAYAKTHKAVCGAPFLGKLLYLQ